MMVPGNIYNFLQSFEQKLIKCGGFDFTANPLTKSRSNYILKLNIDIHR